MLVWGAICQTVGPLFMKTQMRIAPRWAVVAVLGAVTALFFWRCFLLDQTIYAGDTAYVFVPFRQFLAEALRAGKIPLWNPFLFGGTPALAESQYQVFYPINALLVWLGAPRGMSWILAIHLFWMGAGTYLFLRASLGVGRLAALFGAISFAFGASVQMRLGIPVYTDAAAWIPWVLWGYERARRAGGAWVAVPALALALQLGVGGAQYSYYTVITLALYHGFCLRGTGAERAAKRGAWAALGWTLGAGAALAMAQLLPEWELARLSDRGTNASYEFAIVGSLLPRHFLLVTFFPKFYGLYTSAPLGGFLVSSESAYLGAATLALLGAASATARRAPAWFWTLVALFSLFLALGVYNPLYPLMFRYVPGVATFRGAGNWLLITSLSCAALAALGLQAILDGNQAARARAFGVSVVATLIAAGILLSPLGAQIYATPDAPFAPWGQVALFAGVALLLALGWKPPRALANALTPRRLGGALLLVLVLDLFAVSQDMELNQTVLASDLEAVPPAVSRLKSVNDGPAPARFWNSSAPVPLEPWQVQQTLSPFETDAFRARQSLLTRSVMPSCVAAAYGVPGLTGAFGALMPLARHPKPIYLDSTPLPLRLRWLRLLGARYHLTYGAPLQADFAPISTEQPAIYRDDAAFPRAFWVGRVVPVTRANALETVNGASFDPAREVALETQSAPPAASPDIVAPTATAPAVVSSAIVAPTATAPTTTAPTANVAPRATAPTTVSPNASAPVVSPAASRLPLGAATWVRANDTDLALDIRAPAAGQLVVMDSFYPGWRARVDGRAQPIVPANFTGRAVEVGAGTHRVEMRFEPQSVRLGVFVSLLTLGFLAGLWGANWRRR